MVACSRPIKGAVLCPLARTIIPLRSTGASHEARKASQHKNSRTDKMAPQNALQRKGEILFGHNLDYGSSDKTHIQT